MNNKLICFFYSHKLTKCEVIFYNKKDPSFIAELINQILQDKKYSMYSLACISDGESFTYKAEYLKSLMDFKCRNDLL